MKKNILQSEMNGTEQGKSILIYQKKKVNNAKAKVQSEMNGTE